ncbi:MAG: SDR family oxidoreductase [Deltaproteobacteria bacterium]|nr:SDR family oxidoreductase [Deltaproteobacteria bacterium]
MRESLVGRVAVVTGAGSGIGRALALELAARGARVALIDYDAAGLAATRDMVNQLDDVADDVATWVCDVRDAARCEAVMAEIVARWGGVDVLVNNAGISAHGLAADTRLDVLRRVMDVNFHGAVHCTLAALPSLCARRGVIVAMSSVAGFAPLFGRSAYSASKHALHGWFETLRSELADTGASVMLVCPSFVRTAIDAHALAGDGGRARSDKPIVGRPVEPGVIARAVADGIEARRRELVPTPVARAAWWLSRLAPSIYERVMRRQQSQGYR